MLYDKRWDKPQADVFSLDSLIEWLEMQPGGTEYCSMVPDSCLMGQFARAMGTPTTDAGNKSCDLTEGWPFNSIAFDLPRTFGAALDRARKLRTLEKPSQDR